MGTETDNNLFMFKCERTRRIVKRYRGGRGGVA